MKLSEALVLANEVKAMLGPHTARLEIGGGIRRQKAEPHDIEIICIPKFGKFEKETLMGTEYEDYNELDEFIRAKMLDNTFEKGDPDSVGRRAPFSVRYYRIKYKREQLDIFGVLPPAQWGVEFILRTGSADFNKWLVVYGNPDGIYFRDGHLERITFKSDNGIKVIDTRLTVRTDEEADVFRVMGLDWIEPKNRNEAYLKKLFASNPKDQRPD